MHKIELLTNKRDVSFEIMRTLGCFFVVAIHVFASYFSMYGNINTRSWLFAESIMTISRFSIVLFIMVSGALLLEKDITIKNALKKATYFTLILIAWSIAYILISDMFLDNRTYSIQKIIVMFLNNQISTHLWYLYMLIGVYITLPFIRNIIKNFELKLLKYYLIVFLSFSMITMMPLLLSTLLNLNIKIYLIVPFMNYQLGCLIIGYFINKHLQINKLVFILSIVSFFLINIATASLTYLESYKRKSAIDGYYNNNFANIILSAVCVFIIVKYISKYISEKSLWTKFFSFIGSISFEIYLVHLMVKSFYEKKMQKYFDSFIPRLSLKFLFELLFVFILSVLIAYLIKLITKQVKKIILKGKGSK
ncbi:acyltransferase [Clostridium sp. CF012]|uniref:acyltransferase n=1 Tax=Clostridium sp. CF012 TaxID=2843319 RepID=UPI001C0D43DD|nr:acyltransferase family protein [Clostridium sp. CF012]MBU3145497.1 acyltransferase family protein [Clostridium sp. CF012]